MSTKHFMQDMAELLAPPLWNKTFPCDREGGEEKVATVVACGRRNHGAVASRVRHSQPWLNDTPSRRRGRQVEAQRRAQEVAIEGAAVPELVKLKQERDAKLAEDTPKVAAQLVGVQEKKKTLAEKEKTRQA